MTEWVKKFDVIECQQLRVSGADLIDGSALTDVTTKLLEISSIDLSILTTLRASFPAFTVTNTAGASNVATSTIQVVDALGASLAGVRTFDVFFSDSATGVDFASTWVIDSVAITTGKILKINTSVKHYTVQSDATGKVVLSLTDTAKGAGYVCAVKPMLGSYVIGAVVATTGYGA